MLLITPEQLQALQEALPPRWRAFLVLGAWCSLRFGEITALRRRHIDLDAGIVRVEQSAAEVVGRGRVYDRPKTEAGRRTVAIPPHVLPILAEHLELWSEPGEDGLVFVGPLGGRVHNTKFATNVWRPAKRAAGVPDHLHFHDCRAAGATLAARAGATTKELQARLGHTTPTMALKYQRAEAERDRLVAERMSQYSA